MDTNANSKSGFKAETLAVPSFRYFQTLRITATPRMTPTIPDKIIATTIMFPSADVSMQSLLQRSCGRYWRQEWRPTNERAFVALGRNAGMSAMTENVGV